MEKIIFYSYSKCSTCRKASKWLDQEDFKYEFKDIVKEPPLPKYLTLALTQYSDEKKRIFNTRGKSFKSIDLDIFSSTNKEIIQILINDGKLIKRPFLVYKEKKIILGFNEAEYSTFIIKD